MNKENNKAHFYWIIAILVAVIIYLITVKLGENTRIVELINFASTITSLVLAVLAIVYAYLSNASVAQSMTKLGDASTEISDTAKDVSDAAKELKGKIEAIPTKLESMEGKVDQLILVRQTPEQNETRPPSEKEKEAASEIVNLFMEKMSVVGLLAIYGFYISFKEKKSFNFSSLFRAFYGLNAEYAKGMVITMSSAGLLKYTRREEQVNINEFNAKLATFFESQFKDSINKILDTMYDDGVDKKVIEKDKLEFGKYIDSIDSYFK